MSSPEHSGGRAGSVQASRQGQKHFPVALPGSAPDSDRYPVSGPAGTSSKTMVTMVTGRSWIVNWVREFGNPKECPLRELHTVSAMTTPDWLLRMHFTKGVPSHAFAALLHAITLNEAAFQVDKGGQDTLKLSSPRWSRCASL